MFINRSYYPDVEATGQLLTQLCEDLAEEFEISVIAGQPNRNLQQTSFRRWGSDFHNGVEIRRVWHTTFRKSSFVGRAINYISFLVSAAFASLTAKRPDVVVVESDPPMLCLLGGWIKWRFRCKSVVYLQDIYPQLAVALGKLPDNWITKLLERRFAAAYRTANRVVVLSDDMRDVVLEADVPPDSIDVIPNWVDVAKIGPAKRNNAFRTELGLNHKFVVMYSGNLGQCQGLHNILQAAEQLKNREDIVFLLVGDGAAKKHLLEQAERCELSNIRFVDYQPFERLGESLSAADIHLVPVDARVSRYLMPSKLYGALASATPILTVAPEDSELAKLTTREQVGANVEPDQPKKLAEKIAWFFDRRDDFDGVGERARALAVESFDRPVGVDRFRQMIRQILEPTSRPTFAETTLKSQPT